jgi:membrane dipeptidase
MESVFLIDGHADILYRMEKEKLSFYGKDSKLQASHDALQQGRVGLQFFALYTDPSLTPAQSLTMILAYIDTFYRKIVNETFHAVHSFQDLVSLQQQGKMGGFLSIEGGDCLQSDLRILHIMYRLGVRAVGLTWNHANCIADGVGEARGAGLTAFGKELIREMNKLGMIVDVSHLSKRGFWDVAELSSKPFIASHSNCEAVYKHRRNLDDDQIRAIIRCNGTIGVTFVPYFICAKEAKIDDLIRHIDHILSLGGQKHIAIGSDFDGISETMVDLRSAYDFPRLLEEIDKRYGREVLLDITGRNLMRVMSETLQS